MGQVDIDGIKTQLKSILDTANTTTGSPIDLSLNMDTRVSRVMMIHPSRIPIQPSFFPFVTMFIADKSIEQKTMGHRGSQASALREGILTIDVIGAVYEPFFDDINQDQGSENVEQLMENIEEVLKSNSSLNSTVSWQMPTRIQFDQIPYDEEAHLRTGIINLECKIFY